MGLFGKQKQEVHAAGAADAPVLILGGGCAKCNELEGAVRQALAQLGLQDEVGHVTDFTQIAAYGVMSTPALVVGGRVVSCGRVPGQAELREMLREALEKETLEQGPAV